METGFYITLSGQLATQKRLETIAQNMANVNTTGYRAAGVDFSTIVSKASSFPMHFASTGQNFVVEKSGGFRKTGGSLDVGVQGDGYLAFEGPQGIFYSRDGRLMMLPDGQLTSLLGYPLLDPGAAAISVDPRGGPPVISRDGSVRQDGAVRGSIGLFSVNLEGGYERFENSGIRTNAEADPIANFTTNGIMQGYIEDSNVNPISEMVRLIEVTRAFESVSSIAERAQEAERSAIQALASR